MTKDVPAYEVWAGNPAKKIGERFDKNTYEKIQKTAWWNWDAEMLQNKFQLFGDVEKFLEGCKGQYNEKENIDFINISSSV